MDNISFTDFEKVDIRIGTVVKAEVPEWSHWVMKLKVDFGPEIGQKQCFSGIMKFYKPEEIEGKEFPFVINLEPRKMGPEHEISEAMMIMATPEPQASLMAASGDSLPEAEAEEVAPVLFQLQKNVDPGTKVR